jgi:hypothetical protein
LALEAPPPVASVEDPELERPLAELHAQIAAAEGKRDFVTAGRLKTELLNVQRATRK